MRARNRLSVTYYQVQYQVSYQVVLSQILLTKL